jgi:hypothetical protein
MDKYNKGKKLKFKKAFLTPLIQLERCKATYKDSREQLKQTTVIKLALLWHMLQANPFNRIR